MIVRAGLDYEGFLALVPVFVLVLELLPIAAAAAVLHTYVFDQTVSPMDRDPMDIRNQLSYRLHHLQPPPRAQAAMILYREGI